MFWGPLFLETLFKWGWPWEEAKKSISHEVCLHIAFLHPFISPLLYILLDKETRLISMSCLGLLLNVDKGEELSEISDFNA